MQQPKAPMTKDPKGRTRIPSCDPCRRAKLACDHLRPVCSRCLSKEAANECVYRKHPFKRRRALGSTDGSQTRSAEWASGQSPRLPSPPPLQSPPQDLQLTLYPNTGFQGSSSLDKILDNIEQGSAYGSSFDPSASETVPSPDKSRRGEGESIRHTMLVMSSTALIEDGAQVLELLATLLAHGVLQNLFEEWEGKGLEVHLGAFLVRPFLDSITALMSSIQQEPDGLLALSRRLFDVAKVSTQINGAMSRQEFAECYTGPNLKWETIGLILALAGNAASKLRAPHSVCKTEQERQTLRRNLLHSSNRCASFCGSLDILNDVYIIFVYESFLLYSVYFGHQSFRAWDRLNNAISALFGRGLHQRFKNESNIPFFLVELRKHIFALIYGSDISFAVFLGRPPRISRRHCFIHMPLDLNGDAYEMSQGALREEIRHLDERGWNQLGQIRALAVTRWSMTTSKIREEALEAVLGQEMMDRGESIRNLRVKIEEAWNELPSFLAVPAREVWQERRPGQQTDTLYLIRLFYFQTMFLIEWTASVHGMEDPDALFVVASELLAWVNEALIRRECLHRLGLNTLAWRVSSFGLPAAGALAKCLMVGYPERTRKWQSPSSIAKAIHNFSILIAHMDHLYDSSDGNFKLFFRAKSILKYVIESMAQVPGSARVEPLSPVRAPTTSPLASEDAFVQWEFGSEFWIGLPGPESTEANQLDSTNHFTNLWGSFDAAF